MATTCVKALHLVSVVSLTTLMLDAAPLAAQATWGPSAWMGSSGAASLYKSLSCPTGKYAIGVQAHAGVWLHGLMLECAFLGPNGEHQNPDMVPGMIGDDDNGTTKQLRCSGGEGLVGFRGRSGWWIDRIEIACKRWNRANGGTEGSIQWRGVAGGTGGEAYGPITCAGKYAVYRVEGNGLYANFPNPRTIGRYRFYCKAV